MEQKDLFAAVPVVLDAAQARAAAEDGIERGERGLASQRGQEALAAARRVAARLKEFTTDDVWEELGTKPAGHDAPSFMGSVMRLLSQADEICRTGRTRASLRPEQHRKMIIVWKRNCP